MGCLQMSLGFGEDSGKCNMWDEEIEMNGCDENGVCICSDDPDPSYTCEDYQTDYPCSECGADLNVEDCGCEEE